MNTSAITTVMKKHPHTRRFYIGTFPSNRLPRKPIPNTCFISNTDPDTKPGEHWVAFYVDHLGYVYYFDPYGIPPVSINHLYFLSKSSQGRWYHNSKQVQTLLSKNCGNLCINFLIESCRMRSPTAAIRQVLNFPPSFTDRILNSRTVTNLKRQHQGRIQERKTLRTIPH